MVIIHIIQAMFVKYCDKIEVTNDDVTFEVYETCSKL